MQILDPWLDNYSVSREAIVRRLLTFGRTTDDFYRRKRAQYAGGAGGSQESGAGERKNPATVAVDRLAELEAHLPSDFDGLDPVFACAPDGGAMFRPPVERCDGIGLDVQFEACPLKSAWLEAGMAEGDVALFCEMEAAGFQSSSKLGNPVTRAAAA